MLPEDHIEVSFVCGRYKTRDIILEELCSKHNLKFFRIKNINSREFLEKIRKFNCELFISMSFDQIFREEIIEMPKYKIINCHAGKLPFYRGRNILNWVIINDEKEFGITVHYVDNEIDTGDIKTGDSFIRIVDFNSALDLKVGHRFE
ncbi:formyltransferase family protein [Candidatus Thioglobus sp.]|nr:formyltransferase family protein [Candidatus Thioglobus sp.]